MSSLTNMFGQRLTALERVLNRPRLSTWQQFLFAPCCFLARQLYAYHIWQHVVKPPARADAVSIVCISDTHNSQPKLPAGDILVHAGDLTQAGSPAELQAALAWLRAQRHAHKVVVAGNHDQLLDATRDHGASDASARAALDWTGIIYLEDAAATVTCENGRRIRFYGSPRSPRFGNWAFQYARGGDNDNDVWAGAVAAATDVLVTHGPPRAHLDRGGGNALGCTNLLRELWRVRPRLHVFGHIHEGRGTEWVPFDGAQAAYERTVVAGGGLWNLLRLGVQVVAAMLRPAAEATCLLVNPAIVGGWRDDRRREPIVVYV